MAKSIGSVFVNISARTKEFERKIRASQNKLRKFGRTATSIGKSIGLGIGAPLSALGTASVNTFQKFEQGMAKVKAISGATATEFANLKANAELLGATTRFTSNDVATLQLNFSKLGLTAKEIEKVTKATLDLALATGEDLGESARVSASVMRGFNLDASEMGRITDVMAKSFSSSALDLEKFSVGMANAQVNARLAGFSIEETTAMLATLVDTGTDASKAGTDLRSIFLELNKKGLTLADAMKRINEATTDTEKQSVALALTNKRNASSLVTLAENAPKLKSLSSEFENASGSAEQMSAIMDNTLQGSLFKVRSAVEAVQIRFGELSNVYLKPLVDRIAQFISTNKEAIAQFMKTAVPIGIVATALAGLVFIAGQFAFAITALSPFIAVLVGGLGILSAKFIIIAGLIAGVIYIMHKLDLIKPLVNGLIVVFNALKIMVVDAFNVFKNDILPIIINFIDNAKRFFVSLANSVSVVFTNITNGIKKIMLNIITFFTDKIQMLTNMFPTFFAGVNNVIDTVKGKFEEAKAPVIEYFKSVAEEATTSSEVVTEAMAEVVEVVDNTKKKLSGDGDGESPFDAQTSNLFKNMAEGAKTALRDLKSNANDVADDMKQIFDNLSNSMTDAIQEFVNTGKASFRDLVSDMLSQIQRLIIQKGIVDPILGSIGDALFPSAVTPKNMGGTVREGKPYLVGESGAEMFVPRQSGRIIPSHKLGGEGINVNFNVQATDANSFDAQLASREAMIVGMIQQAYNRAGKQGI